jgi:ribosomal protein S18 acetylase RimI-like enzyme
VILDSKVDLRPVPIARSDLDATARMLAAAFDDDPAYAYLFPDPATRASGLGDFFRRNLATHLPYACTFVAREGERVVATVTVRPPEGVKISALTMIRQGFVPYAIDHGLAAVRRLLAVKRAYDGLEAEIAKHRPHWHVHMMAVDPQRQGGGIGSKLLEAVIEHAIAPRPDEGHLIVLSTHKERNVTFYRRAGFDVVDERDLVLEAGARAYRVWSMTRGTGKDVMDWLTHRT